MNLSLSALWPRLWLLKSVLSLPSAALRFLSGSGVVHVHGRTLDAQIQFLWRAWFTQPNGRVALRLTDKSLESARQEWQEAAALMSPSPEARVRFETIGADGTPSPFGVTTPYISAPIPGLLIRPLQIAPDAPLLIFFHQGGGILGGSELSKSFCALLAHEARCPIFLPDYRLAPASRFPAALDDARIALDWAQANAFRLGAASGQVAVGGALIGANLATRLCLDLKRDFKPLPVAQLLITPLLDLSDSSIKSQSALGVWPITSADIGVMISHYAGGGVDLSDPRISPAQEKLIIGQPRTFVVSAGLDPLAPQAETFVKRLMSARTKVLYRRYDTLPLGFDLFAGVVDAARDATVDIAREWLDLLRTVTVEPDLTQDVA